VSEPRAAAASRDLTGSRLGPYEIRGRLGAGGMGEVFRARDTRLDRDVALKILSEAFTSDPARIRRFEREARALAALNHPNIVTVYEVDSAGSVSYIAMELLDGRTLRDLTSKGPLPLKRALDLAFQVASGLARAHEAGIIHRDLKPENVMVSKDDVAKILDFGLAKRMPFEGEAGSSESTLTHEGSIVGTVSYMSPEQAAGQAVDFRSDQFSFGSILYEMASGNRAFQRKSAVETLAAIINEEPEPIEKADPRVPVPLRWILARCLAKEPAARYASTQDLAQDLTLAREHWTEISGTSSAAPAAAMPRRLRFVAAVAAAVVLAALGAAFVLGKRAGERPIPDFQRLTFRHGIVWSARFAPDGRTVVYAATWDGAPIRLFSTRTDGRDSIQLELADADLASVSSLAEIAMLLDRPSYHFLIPWVGTLARAPLEGGAPRELTDAVACADWAPDGKSLAIVREVGRTHRLEFPIGKVLYETKDWIQALRFSPKGDRIAFLVRGSVVSVETVDLAGNHSVLSRNWKRGSGLAWSPDGSEVWYSANERGWRSPLYAVSLAGRQRLVMRLPTWINLQDISRDGRILVSLAAFRSTTRGLPPGETEERDLSWHEGSLVKSMTPDGKTLLFDEGSEGIFHTIYVRSMAGSPAKRLGDGRALAISPDGRWVAANAAGRGSQTVLLPTGAGETKVLEGDGHHFEEAAFFPDGKRILLLARDPGHGDRSYVQGLPTGNARALAPEGVSCNVVSPDGKEVACIGPQGEGVTYSVEGGASRPIPGFRTGEEGPIVWSSDGRFLFVGPVGIGGPFKRTGDALRVFRLDLTTGKRELWREFRAQDRATLLFPLYYFAMTPDGRSYAYSSFNAPTDLYLVTGLR
jgi:Tol biopolymer transport system component